METHLTGSREVRFRLETHQTGRREVHFRLETHPTGRREVHFYFETRQTGAVRCSEKWRKTKKAGSPALSPRTPPRERFWRVPRHTLWKSCQASCCVQQMLEYEAAAKSKAD